MQTICTSIPQRRSSLDNVSEVFRCGWLAHTLGISVLEFLQLRTFTGLDPFARPRHRAAARIIGFIQLVQALSTAGMIPAQALYLMWNSDNAGTFTPPPSVITGLAAALVADFAAVDTEFVLPAGGDPDGSIAKKLMTLVYGTATTNTFFGLLNNTFTTSIAYSVPPGQNALPDSVLAAGTVASGQLSYDNMAKQLSFSGVLTPSNVAAIDNAIPVIPNTLSAIENAISTDPTVNDPNLAAGIQVLHTANQQAVAQFFAGYPELAPLYAAYVTSTDPLQTKRTSLLESSLVILKDARNREQALASVTSAAGVDPSFATALLQDATVLHADTDPGAPAVNDLIAMQNQGLTAQFYWDNNPIGAPDVAVDSTATLSYAQTGTISGDVSTTDVMHTLINGADHQYRVQSTDTTLTVLAASIAASINATTDLVPTSPTSTANQLPMNQLVTATSAGPTVIISGRDPSGANGAFTLTTNTSASAAQYTAGTQLPAGTATGAIAAVWSGYLTVAQNGFYDINIATDQGAHITLDINGTEIPGAINGGTLWSNLGPISLSTGTPIPITLTATSIKTTFSVRWTSKGLGWQPIPTASLYPFNLVNRLANTYTRFLKAAALASALSLTAREIAYLGTATNYAVNTTCTSMVAAGAATFTPSSMTNINIGSALLIDSGTNTELVTVTSVAPTAAPPTFTAVVTKPHDGTSTPFTVNSASQPNVGQGWLNFLTTQGPPDPATAASLAAVLTSVLDFARIKQALSPSDERLLAVLANPTAVLPGAQSTPQYGLLSLTGWSQLSVNALLTHFFPAAGLFPAATTAATLSSVDKFRRIYDAYTLVTSTGLSPAILISAITNTPTPATVGALQSALRARYAESDWLTVVGPINDTARIQQRDALVAYILQQSRDSYETLLITLNTANVEALPNTLTFADTSALAVGMPVAAGSAIAPGTTIATIPNSTTITLTSAVLAQINHGTTITFAPLDKIPIIDSDSLYDLLLVDTQTQPAVLTSRIRLALSMVQLFIERIIRDLEPSCAAADIDTTQWSWMKTYRVWQANREVFLWPENWAYPELRDDQSPLFQQMMKGLLQGDITDDAASAAYLDYLTGLEDVSKLEPCGMYYVPSDPDTDETTYVVARTAGAHRKYYFRELTGGSWTPWTQVNIDCEDTPLTPVVWNGRLFLFWLKAFKQTAPPNHLTFNGSGGTEDLGNLAVSDFQSGLSQGGQTTGTVTASAALCWTEYYNGTWQQTKTSDVNRPAALRAAGEDAKYDLSGDGSFDVQRTRLRVKPIQFPNNPSTSPFWDYIQKVYGFPPPESLVIAIGDSASYIYGGFVLHNTHSLPIRFEDMGSHPDDFNVNTVGPAFFLARSIALSRQFGDTTRNVFDVYTGGRTKSTPFAIYYGAAGTSLPEVDVLDYSWMPRATDTQPLYAWNAPFIYEDRQAQFYVTTGVYLLPVPESATFGMPAIRTLSQPSADIQSLILTKQPPASPPSNADGIAVPDPATLRRLVSASSNVNVALSTQTPVSFDGRLITPVASTDRPAVPKTLSEIITTGGSHS